MLALAIGLLTLAGAGPAPPLLLEGATVYRSAQEEPVKASILMRDGKIAFVGDAGIAPVSGRQMLFSSALPQGKVSVRKIRQRTDDDATVEVRDAAGKATQFRMVREARSWKVDLSSGEDLR